MVVWATSAIAIEILVGRTQRVHAGLLTGPLLCEPSYFCSLRTQPFLPATLAARDA